MDEASGEELIGRAAETDRIASLLDALPARGAGLVIHGAPGIGKSALLANARSAAERRGYDVLAVEGAESEAELAFAGLHQLLRPLRAHLSALSSVQRQALGPALGTADGDDPDPFRVAVAALELITAASADRPIVLLVDDAQWLDRSTLGVITFIARRLSDEPVVLIAAVRRGEASPLDVARLPTLHLEPLGSDAAVRLLDAVAPELLPASRTQVLGEAEGNPLALIELGRHRPQSPTAPVALTERLQRAFAARLDDLSGDTRRTLLAAALDPQASLGELVAFASLELGTDARPEVLDGAVAADLIAVDGSEIRFVHPLIRTAVAASALPAAALSTYAALADVVVDPERRLWHRARAAIGVDDDLAGALEAHAATVRRRGAVLAASVALERAAELTADPARRGERLVRAAEVAYELGTMDRARSLLAEAERAELSSLDLARTRWIRLMLDGGFWSQPGVVGAFVAIADQIGDGGHPDTALRSLVPIAHRCWWVPSRPQTRRFVADAARRVASGTADPRMLAVTALADPEDAGPEVRRQLATLRLGATEDAVAEAYLGIAAEKAGDLVDAAQRLAHAIARLREQGRLVMLTQTLVHFAWASIHTGDADAASTAGREAGALARDTAQPQYGLTGELLAILATAPAGDEVSVESALALPELRLTKLGGGPLLAPAYLARGAVALAEGRHADALDHLWPVFDRTSATFHTFMRWHSLLDLVEAATSCGRDELAAGVLDELEAVLTRSDPPVLRAMIAAARPLLASDDDAESLFAAALSGDLAGYPMATARTRFALGRWLRRQRRSAAARDPLRSAAEGFAALGATRWSERARQELRATGQRLNVTGSGHETLTAQEMEIAELAAQGLTNRQIGERLFLSPRTVGTHLYRLFPKLGISGRAQLRDALESLDGD